MAMLSLREAAELAGTSKSTVFRAVRSGRLSATRDDVGNFMIDPAELSRVYPPRSSKSERSAAERIETRIVGQDATDSDAIMTRLRGAELESELKALRAILDVEKERSSDLKQERDHWREQAQRLAIAPPVADAVATEPRTWWPWRRRA